MKLTQRDLAQAIHAPYQRVNEIINGCRGMPLNTALRLAKFLGIAADLLINLRLRSDLYHAKLNESEQLQAVQPMSTAR